MKDIDIILADCPGLGKVRLCACNAIHVNIGPVTLNLEPAAFFQMTNLMSQAAKQLSEICKSCAAEEDMSRAFGPSPSRMTH